MPIIRTKIRNKASHQPPNAAQLLTLHLPAPPLGSQRGTWAGDRPWPELALLPQGSRAGRGAVLGGCTALVLLWGMTSMSLTKALCSLLIYCLSFQLGCVVFLLLR